MKVLLDTNVYIVVTALALARNVESVEVKIIKSTIDQKFRVKKTNIFRVWTFWEVLTLFK